MTPGQAKYEREALNWPDPLGWDNLSEGAKAQWEERAKSTSLRRRDLDVQQGESV